MLLKEKKTPLLTKTALQATARPRTSNINGLLEQLNLPQDHSFLKRCTSQVGIPGDVNGQTEKVVQQEISI